MWTNSDNVSVGQEPTVPVRPNLLGFALTNQPCRIETPIEVLRQPVVLRRRRATEVIEGQTEPAIDICLDRMLLVAKSPHVLAGRSRAELRRGAVLVGTADVQDLGAGLTAE